MPGPEGPLWIAPLSEGFSNARDLPPPSDGERISPLVTLHLGTRYFRP
jgi:hypothetical protein